jgi:hypothetical protein
MTLEVSDEIGKSMSDELGGRRLSASTRSMTDGEENLDLLGNLRLTVRVAREKTSIPWEFRA